ncbi:hypothetical protein RN001_005889 [Aquatica leii]|uniref:Ferritin n=1 Tax=Aquatica leii TaxID=1421715 RepID=A0AAN7SS54_9COLE|nr:hypothetical protein RN001_005889 [Aquatica leii]
MKVILSLTIIFTAIALTSTNTPCDHGALDIPDKWIDMVDSCYDQMKNQVQEELKASIQYLAMGAHFSKDTVNRPGFAKFFFNSASEERQHALKLISYLLMRGKLTTVSDLIKKNIVPKITIWHDGLRALKDALELEGNVTQKIQNVIKVCETPLRADEKKFNDYHLVDYLTGEFLEEQYKGQQELAGKVSNLEKMKLTHKQLGEFMFDKKLLEE